MTIIKHIKLYQKKLLQNYTKNLLQNHTKTCNKIFWNKVFLLQFYCNNIIMSLRPSLKNNFVFLYDTSLKLCRLAFIQRYDFANNGLIKSYLRRLECCCLIHYINLLRKKNCNRCIAKYSNLIKSLRHHI